MEASLIHHPRLVRAVLLGSAAQLALLALLLLPGSARVHAQQAPDQALQITSVQHDVRGVITLVVTPPPEGSTVDRVSVRIDRVPATVSEVLVPRREGASIVIAIDTSGSMAGAPIVSARDAARRLVERLDPRDAVAIVGFAAQPNVLSGFTTDRSATLAALAAVEAAGETALFEAVALSSELLEARPDAAPRVLVLLSDGQNSGISEGAGSREASIAQLASGGAIVHAFGLGAEADEAYLGTLADATSGSYSGVAGEQFLGALFELLGAELSSTWRVEIAVPPLPLGEHTIELVATIDGVLVTRATTIDVNNARLITASVATGEGLEFVVIDVASAVPASQLRIEATVGETPVAYSGGQLFVDPWTSDPGAQTVRIQAFLGDTVAAITELPITVPALEPELTVRVNPDAVPPSLVASGRAQGFGVHTLRVLADGEEIATTGERELRVNYPVGREISVEIVGPEAGSAPLAREVVAAQGGPAAAAGGSGGLNLIYPLLAAAVLAAAAIGFVFMQRRRARARPSYRMQRRFRAPREQAGRPDRNGPVGNVLSRGPNGQEQMVAIGLRPLTIGTAANCDIVIEGEGIQAVHARLSARGNGEFQIHGLATASSRPFNEHSAEEWAVLRTGESLAIGRYELTITDESNAQLESAS